MLRVRCLRGGSRGAEAVHYIGSQVRARPPRFASAGAPTWSFLVPLGSSAAAIFAGSRELGGVAGLGTHPAGTRGLCASPAAVAISAAASLFLHGACGPEGTGVTRTPFSRKALFLGFIALCGHRVGHACGAGGRRGRVGIWDGGSAQAHSKCNMDPESREVGAGLVCTQSFCPVPALHFAGV